MIFSLVIIFVGFKVVLVGFVFVFFILDFEWWVFEFMVLMLDFLYRGKVLLFMLYGLEEFSFLFKLLFFLWFDFLFGFVKLVFVLFGMVFGLFKVCWEIFGVLFVLELVLLKECILIELLFFGVELGGFFLGFWLFFKDGFLFVFDFILVCCNGVGFGVVVLFRFVRFGLRFIFLK